MRTASPLLCVVAVVAAVGSLAPLPAQTFAANTGTDPAVMATPATKTKLVAPGRHRSLEQNKLYGRVRNGAYTVDGMVAKLKLNYDIDGVNHLYFFVPGVGTAVLSAVAPTDEVANEAELHGNDLSFIAGDHRFKVTGIALAGIKGSAPEHLFVRLDRAAWQLGRQPMLGFGDAAEMPYTWPGSLAAPTAPAPAEESRLAPPLPPALLPSPVAVHAAAPPAAGARPVALRPVAMR